MQNAFINILNTEKKSNCISALIYLFLVYFILFHNTTH